jgi:CubicO group peptidase (beta-lactamase class C family)
MADVQGTTNAGLEVLADLLSGTLDDGSDLGASVAVTIEGESVVDLWGGWLDEEHLSRWEKNTITNVWSTTKTMISLCALVLVERGQLDVFAPVAAYWPEFAANGKEHIEVRMATVDEYVLPPDVNQAYKDAKRSANKETSKFIQSGKWKGYTPPPMPKK